MRAALPALGLALVGLALGGPLFPASAADPQQPTVENTLGMKLVLIPAGEFTFSDRSAPKIRHRQVRIEKPFYLGTTEVTIAQYGKFVEATKFKGDAETGAGGYGWNGVDSFKRGPHYNWKHSGDGDTDDMPVANVSWNDTRAFCDWLSKQEEKTYRLPTEAEWEYACRAGTTTAYSFGDDPEGLATAGNGADLAYRTKFSPELPDPDFNIKASDGYIFRAPVGKFQANPWGLFDMHGNLWEWCGDLFRYPEAKTRTVRRGGSWRDGPPFTRSDYRQYGDPLDYAHNMTGFRVARDAAEK